MLLSSRHTDFLIVGGGVIGMMLARELAFAGMSVRILERGECGKESSWAGGGIVSPLYPWRYPGAVTRLASWSQREYPRLAQELSAQSGCDVEYVETGLLILRVEDHKRALEWAAENGRVLESVDQDTLRSLQPGLSDHWENALWMPGVANVRNPRLAHALRACLNREPRVTIEEGCAADSLLKNGGRVSGARVQGGSFGAGHTIVCGGAWSAQVLEQLGYQLPVIPVRGQMLIHHPAPGLLKRVVLADGRYLIPRADGRILIGSTLEYVGFDKRVSADAYASLRTSALGLLPGLHEVPVEAHWSGLRPGSPDGIPVMGDVPGTAGLSVCAGHFRNGLVLAPASARFMADQLLGRETCFTAGDYMPGASTAQFGSMGEPAQVPSGSLSESSSKPSFLSR